jgi:hypothetical protein
MKVIMKHDLGCSILSEVGVIPAPHNTFVVFENKDEKEPYMIERVWAFKTEITALGVTKNNGEYESSNESPTVCLMPIAGWDCHGGMLDDGCDNYVFIGTKGECDKFVEDNKDNKSPC